MEKLKRWSRQAFQPVPIMSALLLIYTCSVISRVPHHILHDLGKPSHQMAHRSGYERIRESASALSSPKANHLEHLEQAQQDLLQVSGTLEEGEDDGGGGGGTASASFGDSAGGEGNLEDLGVGAEGYGGQRGSGSVATPFDPENEYADIELPSIEVYSIEPSYAPRAGGIATIIRGSGFSAKTTSGHHIGRKLQVVIGDVPCDETRYVSENILKCLIPTGTGTNLNVQVLPCACEAASKDKSQRQEGEDTKGVTFSYTEDLLKQVVEQKPALDLIPDSKTTGLQMSRKQLIAPYNLEVKLSSSSSSSRTDPHPDSDPHQPDFTLQNSYAILPEMANLLPAEDWHVKHATCAVVGKSASLWGSRLGPTIDRHNGVFRIDNAPSGSKFVQDVGKKVTYQVLDSNWAEALLGTSRSGVPHVARWWLDLAAVVLWGDKSQSQYVQLKYLYPDANVIMISRDFSLRFRRQVKEFAKRLVDNNLVSLAFLGIRTDELGSLLHSVAMALQVCEKVDIYGVFPRCGRHSRCRQTFFDDSELTAKQKLEHDLEQKFLMALGSMGIVNTTTPVKMRDDGKLIKHPSFSKPVREIYDGTCDEVMCRASSSSSPFQCTKHASTEESTNCRCEKTWGGKYCERDLLELGSPSLASKVMKGIDLRFKGGLLMHQEQIKWREETVEPAIVDEETGEVIQEERQHPKVGYIALPEGTTKNRTSQGDFYELNRHMFNMLPENDDALTSLLEKQHVMSGEKSDNSNGNRGRRRQRVDTCAVIGNSGSLLHNPLGNEIDNHTMVYRFNQAPTSGYEVYTGVKCTHESLNSAWVKALVDTIDGYHGSNDNPNPNPDDPDDPNPMQKKQSLAKGNHWRWRKKDTALVLFELFDLAGIMQHNREQNGNKDRWWKKNLSILRSEWPEKLVLPYNPLFVVWAYNKYGAFKRRFTDLHLGTFPGEKPMSGFYAILFLLQACERVDLYGFEAYVESTGSDLMGTKYHYFDDAVPRHNSHSFDLTQYIYRAIAHANPTRMRIRS